MLVFRATFSNISAISEYLDVTEKKIRTYCDTTVTLTATVFQLGIENGGARLWKKGTSARQKL